MATAPQAIATGLDCAIVASALARRASLELGMLDIAELDAAGSRLEAGQRIYVSHLPTQRWEDTFRICAQLSGRGFDPVPHLPVRLLADGRQLASVLRAAADAGVNEPLLIAGDYSTPHGAFASVFEVLETGALQENGFSRVSLAGHPEGHPRVPWDVICEAQINKWRLASSLGLEVTFVTQFFFAAEPFVQWARLLRSAGVQARLVAGIAGPTGLGRLIKLASRCGVGASMRALASRPAATTRLLAHHEPDQLLMQLSAEKLRQDSLFDGLHVFSLGGFQRTVSWLQRFASTHSVSAHPD
jgi:methylenetetrahydrofolate reductase (NADPH)